MFFLGLFRCLKGHMFMFSPEERMAGFRFCWSFLCTSTSTCKWSQNDRLIGRKIAGKNHRKPTNLQRWLPMTLRFMFRAVRVDGLTLMGARGLNWGRKGDGLYGLQDEVCRSMSYTSSLHWLNVEKASYVLWLIWLSSESGCWLINIKRSSGIIAVLRQVLLCELTLTWSLRLWYSQWPMWLRWLVACL